MTRLLLLLTILCAFTVPAHSGTTLNCAKPPLESVRLLCQANAIKARRVQTVIGGAVVGALLGNLMAKATGGSRTDSTIAGAAAGGLAGYWLSVQNEIAKKSASQTAQAAELKARAAADASVQNTPRWVQPVSATVRSKVSAGVWKPRVLRGRVVRRKAT